MTWVNPVGRVRTERQTVQNKRNEAVVVAAIICFKVKTYIGVTTSGICSSEKPFEACSMYRTEIYWIETLKKQRWTHRAWGGNGICSAVFAVCLNLRWQKEGWGWLWNCQSVDKPIINVVSVIYPLYHTNHSQSCCDRGGSCGSELVFSAPRLFPDRGVSACRSHALVEGEEWWMWWCLNTDGHLLTAGWRLSLSLWQTHQYTVSCLLRLCMITP